MGQHRWRLSTFAVMAVPDLAPLDVQHARQQNENAAAIATLVLAYYAQVRSDDLSGTGGTWLARALPALRAAFDRSARLSYAYARAVRSVQVPGAPPMFLPPLPAANLEAFAKSLTYVGLTSPAFKLALRRADITPPPPEQVMERARVQIAGAVARHATNGGRAAVDEFVKADRVALGYIRVTREGCCYFCAVLASRGAVYKEGSFAQSDPRFEGPGDHKVHDHCHCTMRPVYTPSSAEWPPNTMRFKELWSATGSMLAFRQAYEGRVA